MISTIQAADRQRDFPEDFLFGAATASHQVEGGNRWNDWWEYEESGRLPYRSGRACEHYERYSEDFDLAKSLGHNCHRLSLEWSRIEPQQGQWSDDAISHYRQVLDALAKRGIAPIVTLNHFTLPAWFLRRGGWQAKDSPAIFSRFVQYVTEGLGSSVAFWLTINEPTVYVQQAYINGEWPPKATRAWRDALKVLRNLAKAHVAAYRAIKRITPSAQVGFAHSALHIVPCRPRSSLDRLSSSVRDFLLNRLFFRLIGANPGFPSATGFNFDFVGLNYYTRCCVAFNGLRPTGIIGQACKLDHHENSGPVSDIGWEFYPQGLAAVLRRYAAFGLPMLVTENGIATKDDKLRSEFLCRHLRVIADSLAEGIPVVGYLHWSLMDNYEWSSGIAPTFGLAEVNYDTMQRSPRKSAFILAEICRTGRIAQTQSAK